MKRLFALACALLPALVFAVPETPIPDTLNPEPLISAEDIPT